MLIITNMIPQEVNKLKWGSFVLVKAFNVDKYKNSKTNIAVNVTQT
jgi:hypothetical protein